MINATYTVAASTWAREIEAAARSRLRLTNREWALLSPLLEREAITYEGLAILLFGDWPPVNPTLAVQCQMNGLRRKLLKARLRADPQTHHGWGYSISPEHKRIIIDFLSAR